jgi:hypothetical protein
MKVFSVNAQTKEVKELDIEMQANSVYTFFSSILIDELESLNKHMIYSDANALSEKKTPYYIGEQLIVGDALIVGKEEFTDLDVSITKEELELLIVKDVSSFYQEVLEILSATDINLYRQFRLSHNGEDLALNTEWVLYTFNMADDRTKEYFINELKKALDVSQTPEEFMQKMAGLALNAAR